MGGDVANVGGKGPFTLAFEEVRRRSHVARQGVGVTVADAARKLDTGVGVQAVENALR